MSWNDTFAQRILKVQREGDHDPVRLAAFKEAMYQLFAAHPFADEPASLKQVEPKAWAKQRAERARIKRCVSDQEILFRVNMCRVPIGQVRAIHALIYD